MSIMNSLFRHFNKKNAVSMRSLRNDLSLLVCSRRSLSVAKAKTLQLHPCRLPHSDIVPHSVTLLPTYMALPIGVTTVRTGGDRSPNF